ncbi:hypothetical protein I6N90_21455 [Paenibacillus sp. GSMTC-2017]|uniref:hypothetical protein n=1 Tax=Paenibacillus sp. GSMTC-2017 TaxID=2794350 RepID=UPI001A2574C0|nr:hypothetical protein [Paenibacillus sp. GSMTC-2017]MBH5320363.1 hypothetical protein [Paenibacillus sp. GSMTC-2017]
MRNEIDINKKSSRKIVVRNEQYSWTVSPDSGYVITIAEHEIYKGRRLEVYIQSDIDSYWVNFPNTEHLNLKIIRPRDVEFFICQAIDQGWEPSVKGTPIVFDFDGGNLNIRKSSR